MLSLKQLSYALAVRKHLHFRKAAESCHVSQSALSIALNELEKGLGVQLFERDNKKVLVTPIGNEILDKAQSVLLQVADIQESVEQQKSPLSLPMSIGMIPTIAPYLLPRILPNLNQHYPNLKLTILEEQSHVLVERVRSGEIDTAVLALPFDCEGLLTFKFWEEDFYWVTHRSNVKKEMKEITSDELSYSNLMLLSEGHCLKDHALEACKLKAPEEDHSFGASSLTTLIQMVVGKLGTTLIPEMALDQLVVHHQDLSALHLSEPGPHRVIAFIVRPNYSRLSSIEALIELAKQSLISGLSRLA